MSAPLPSPTGFSCSNCGFDNNSPMLLCPKCGAAQTLPAHKTSVIGRLLSPVGLPMAVLANIAILYVSVSFYQVAAVTPRGTSIRPIGLAFGYLLIGLVVPIVALSLSYLGAALCSRANDNWGARLDKASELLSVIPLPLGLAFFYLIPTLCGLKLSE